MKTKTMVNIFSVILLLIFVVSMVKAQGYSDARSLGMARAYTALARGVDAPLWNPANLKLPTSKKFSLQLFSLGLRFGNSSFSKHSYDIYNGKYLTSSDFQDILDAIPDDGFRLFLDTEICPPFGFAYGPVALTFSGVVASDVRLCKDYFDLPDGWEENHRYDLGNNNHAEAWGYSTATISWAHVVKLPKIQKIILGANFHYILGLGYGKVLRSWGTFYSGEYADFTEGGIKARMAQGGTGFAMDFGVAREYHNWTFSLAFSNLISHITWKRKPQEFEAYFYSTEVLTVYSIAENDSIIESDESTKDISSFSTKLPVELRLGAATTWKEILISLDYHQGFRERPGVTTRPYLAVGSEFSYIGFLPLRLGLGFGGDHKILSALGFGLKLGFFHFDYGINFNGALWPTHAKALSMAVSSSLRF